jgi:tellurite resistance protein TehA-like permease
MENLIVTRLPGHRATQVSDVLPPASWTIVMSTGVVSIDLNWVHQRVLSGILLWFAVAVWLLLMVVLAGPSVYQRGRFAHDAASPVSLTAVAATAVVAARFAMQGYHAAAAVLLVVATVIWAALQVPVLRNWKTPTIGVSFVLSVASDSVALVSASLAVPYRAGWLLDVAFFFLLLALAFYLFTLARFDLRQLLVGLGDHWIAGGALAIAALSAGLVTEAARTLGRLGPHHQILRAGTLVIWCVAVLWLIPLLITEAVRPRLSYDVRRWATVFPLGMYAACSFTVGQVTGISGIVTFARVETWIALAVTLIVAAAQVRSLLARARA